MRARLADGWNRAGVLAAVLLAGVVPGCASQSSPVVQGTGPYAAEAAKMVPKVEHAVGLRFKRPPRIEARSRAEVRTFLERQFGDARAARELAGTEVASDDPAVLEHQADDAEKNGDLELAVRLRFRAGLLRLERCGLLAERDTRTSREIAVILGSPSFTHLAADLEEILYAEVPAGASHADAARTRWPRVPEESVSR